MVDVVDGLLIKRRKRKDISPGKVEIVVVILLLLHLDSAHHVVIGWLQLDAKSGCGQLVGELLIAPTIIPLVHKLQLLPHPLQLHHLLHPLHLIKFERTTSTSARLRGRSRLLREGGSGKQGLVGVGRDACTSAAIDGENTLAGDVVALILLIPIRSVSWRH